MELKNYKKQYQQIKDKRVKAARDLKKFIAIQEAIEKVQPGQVYEIPELPSTYSNKKYLNALKKQLAAKQKGIPHFEQDDEKLIQLSRKLRDERYIHSQVQAKQKRFKETMRTDQQLADFRDKVNRARVLPKSKARNNRLNYSTPEEIKYFKMNVKDILANKGEYFEDGVYKNKWYIIYTYYYQPDVEQQGWLVQSVQQVDDRSAYQLEQKLGGFQLKKVQQSDEDTDYTGYLTLIDVQLVKVPDTNIIPIQNKGVINYDSRYYRPPSRQYTKKGGRYFNYLNKLETLDLTRYQIANVSTQNYDKLIQKHCFLYALEQTGQLTKQQLQQVVSIFTAKFNFKKDNIYKLGIPKDIILQSYQTDGKIAYEYLKQGERFWEQITLKKNDQLKDKCINLGLFEQHYFINDQTQYTKLYIQAIKKYPDLKPDISKIDVKNGNSYFRYGGCTLNALQLIKCLKDNDYFEPIKTINKYNYKDFQHLENAPDIEISESQLYKFEGFKEKDYLQIIDMDFEAVITNGKKYIQHVPFLVSAISQQDADIFYDTCIEGMLKQINNKYIPAKEQKRLISSYNVKHRPKILIRFFNLSYDAQFILNSSFQITNLCQNGSRIIKFSITNICQFDFEDNFLKFNCKLKALPKMFFNAEEMKQIHKELFPYKYYTEERLSTNRGDIKDAYKYLESDASFDEWVQCIEKAQSRINEDEFDLMKFAKFYCIEDVKVQRLANIKMNELSQEKLGLSSNNYISISSVAKAYAQSQHIFDGVCMLSGPLRQYIQGFVCGGRCMVANNGKYHTNIKLQDFDAVSLYPSAMRRCYFPTGIPKKLSAEEIKYYNNRDNLFKITEAPDSSDQNTLFLTVRLFQGPNFKKRMFPLLSKALPSGHEGSNKQGIKNFTNDINNEVLHLTHIRLQDAITYQGYDYEILDGLKFPSRNYTIQTVIEKIFEDRKMFKKQMKQAKDESERGKYNGLQNLFKLIMNSIYGKCIEKLHEKEYILENNCVNDFEINEKGLNILSKYFNENDNIQIVGQKLLIEKVKEVCDETNFGECGIMVLDMSKRIMNEVMCLAEDLKIKIFYQDTDSMHIDDSKIELLASEFKKKFGRELLGEEHLGQFHSDFDSKKGKVLFAQGSYFLGKKCYLDTLHVENGQIDYHIRMKGVSSNCIHNPEDVYKRLFNKETVKFDLAQENVCMSARQKGLQKYCYINLESFERNISFLHDALKEEDMYKF